jgi:hypothetical protein
VNTNTVAHAAIGGFGFQFDNHFWKSYNRNKGITQASFDNYIAPLWREVSPDFSRIGLYVSDWEYTEGVKTWDSEGMQGLLMTLDLLASTNTEIYLATWYHANPPWLGNGYTFNTTAQIQKYVRTNVDLLDYLINTKGYQNIRNYCFANELQTRSGWAILKVHFSPTHTVSHTPVTWFGRHSLIICTA